MIRNFKTMLEEITPIGLTNFRNRKKHFGIKLDDRRRHTYVIGKTGSGKTTLLEHMVISDILAGHGVGIVDPHGEFAEKMLDFVPEERIDDVVYFNPADMEYPIAFNPMEQVGEEFRHLVASGLMGVFKKMWPDAWSARMEYILNNTLLALLELPDATLLSVMRMFAEPEYRKKVVEQVQDPVIKAFWTNEFPRYGQRLEGEALAAIQNKIGALIANPLIRNVLGQHHSTINMREVMDKKKILIVNLSKGRIGEDNSRLLGAMMITRLQLSAMSRVDVPEEQRSDFFLYVDEFQNFATESFASILSEARKYHLSLILAHQYIGQLIDQQNTTVRDAVFGNVGTIISFRVGAADAEFLEKEFMPEFLQNDLVNLPKANIYVKLMIDGVASHPFSAETVPPAQPSLAIYRDVIVENSRKHYGTLRKKVEEKIASEWQEKAGEAMDKKFERREERPLTQVLGGMMRPAFQAGPPASTPRKGEEAPLRRANPASIAPRPDRAPERPPEESFPAPRSDSGEPNHSRFADAPQPERFERPAPPPPLRDEPRFSPLPPIREELRHAAPPRREEYRPAASPRAPARPAAPRSEAAPQSFTPPRDAAPRYSNPPRSFERPTPASRESREETRPLARTPAYGAPPRASERNPASRASDDEQSIASVLKRNPSKAPAERSRAPIDTDALKRAIVASLGKKAPPKISPLPILAAKAAPEEAVSKKEEPQKPKIHPNALAAKDEKLEEALKRAIAASLGKKDPDVSKTDTGKAHKPGRDERG